jgi:hypothetical protein
MKTAKLIKDVSKNYVGTVNLYKLSPPIKDDEGKEYEYVVCSTVNAMFSGIETFIFPSDDQGVVLSWGELEGSQRGTTSHKKVLADAGYTLIK